MKVKMLDKDGIIQHRFICKRNYGKLKKNIIQVEEAYTMKLKISFDKINLFELVKNRRLKNGR